MKSLACLSIVCLILQPTVAADDVISRRKTAVVDVRLSSSGELNLQTLRPDGQALPKELVIVEFRDQPVCSLQTSNTGNGKIRQLRPGIHTVRCGTSVMACRFWTPETAPPKAARKLALVVTNNHDVTRAQFGPGPVLIGPAFAATALTTVAVVGVLIGRGSGNDATPAVLPPASP